MLLGWKNPMFTETGIWAAGLHPARKTWMPDAGMLSFMGYRTRHSKSIQNIPALWRLYVHDLLRP